MATKILLRRGLLSEWTSANPILSLGEPSLVTDTSPPQLKIGDGVTRWLALPYFTVPAHINVTAPLVYDLLTQTLSLATPLDGVVIDGNNF